MRPLLLLAAAAVVFALVLSWGRVHSENPHHANHVPHPGSPMLSVTFAHADHVNQDCVACHHNYVDDTGSGMCFDCHKTDAAVKHLIEEQFHDLCRNCHLEEARAPQAVTLTPVGHGPVRSCSACHTPDNRP